MPIYAEKHRGLIARLFSRCVVLNQYYRSLDDTFPFRKGGASQLICIFINPDSSKTFKHQKRRIDKVTSIRSIINTDMIKGNEDIMCSYFESEKENYRNF